MTSESNQSPDSEPRKPEDQNSETPENSQGEGEQKHFADEGVRSYTESISDEDRESSFEIEDPRWARSEQIKDWLKLGLMVIIYLAWTLLVYWREPGLR